MKKYLLSIITVIMLIFTANITVNAATVEGSANTGWSYDESTSTLTLTNYTSTEVISIDSETCQIYSDGDLNIVLEGTNNLNLTSTYGIYVEGNVTVSGTGTLNISNATNGIFASKNATLKSGTIFAPSIQARGGGITIDDGKVNLTGNITASDGQITINGGETAANLISAKQIVVENGLITAGLSGSHSISLNGGKISASKISISLYEYMSINGGEITVDQGIVGGGYCTISGGKIISNSGFSMQILTLTGGAVEINGSLSGALQMTNGNLFVDGNVGNVIQSYVNGGELTINGELYSGWNTVYIRGGKVTINSETYGIRSGDEDVVISGGEVFVTGQTQALKAGGEIRWSGNCISFLTGSSASNAKVETQYYGEKYVGTTESHSWNSGSITTTPTHLTEGTRTYSCNNCSSKKYEPISKTTAHEFGNWNYVDAANHKRECPCGEMETEAHTWSDATCTAKSKCNICNSERGDLNGENHSKTTFVYMPNLGDNTKHDKKYECCGAIVETATHSGGIATCQEKAKCDICKSAYGTLSDHNYDYNSWAYQGAEGHAHNCQTAGCTAHDTVIGHTSSEAATKDVAETCTECGYIISPALGHKKHTAKTEWTTDDKYHWHECTGCEGQQLDKSSHKDLDNNAKCDTCGVTVPVGAVGEPNEDVNSDGDGLSGGAIAGIAVGSTAVVGIGGFSLIWFVIKKKSWADLLAVFKK